jgi:hypothetical protein
MSLYPPVFNSSVPIVLEAGSASEPVWMLCRGGRSLAVPRAEPKYPSRPLHMQSLYRMRYHGHGTCNRDDRDLKVVYVRMRACESQPGRAHLPHLSHEVLLPFRNTGLPNVAVQRT